MVASMRVTVLEIVKHNPSIQHTVDSGGNGFCLLTTSF